MDTLLHPQAAKAEANIVVLQGQVREIARERDTLREDYRALAAQVRAIDLPAVIERLGGQVDRYDAHKYRLDGEHISLNGERFYNHDRQQGGGGAIDLVMHAAGYDYRETVAYLRDTHGADAAISAATWHSARNGQQQAREIVEHAERPAFRAPTPDVTLVDKWVIGTLDDAVLAVPTRDGRGDNRCGTKGQSRACRIITPDSPAVATRPTLVTHHRECLRSDKWPDFLGDKWHCDVVRRTPFH